MIEKIRHNWIPLALFGGSLGYYYALSSKIFTWVYTSGDAGDWLVQTNWWMVPHCWGKPLFISLIHLVNLFPYGDPVFKLTFFLSVIPGAIIISLTYLIAKHLTKNVKLSVTASLIVLGCSIALSQATVVEQYACAAALFTAAIYFYLTDHRVWTVVFLGLTTAVHEIGLVLAFFLLLIEWRKHKKEWVRLIPLYFVVGILPYALILWMMYDPNTPKLMAGGLNWSSLNTYTGNTTSIAALALTEAPERFKDAALVALMSLGLAWIPVFKGFQASRPWNDKLKYIVAIGAFTGWFYITNLFPSTWKFFIFAIPAIACVAAIGLSKLPGWQHKAVTIGAVVLMVVNGFMFNTNTMAHEEPKATEYVQALEELPQGACVITPRGGAYGFALFYIMSEDRPDIIPLALSQPEHWLEVSSDGSYNGYLKWLDRTYGIEGANTYEIVKDSLAKGHAVYFGSPITPMWDRAFDYDKNGDYLYRVYDVKKYPPWQDLLEPLEATR